MSNSTYLHWRRWALLCGSLVLVAGVAIASFNSLLRADDAPVGVALEAPDAVDDRKIVIDYPTTMRVGEAVTLSVEDTEGFVAVPGQFVWQISATSTAEAISQRGTSISHQANPTFSASQSGRLDFELTMVSQKGDQNQREFAYGSLVHQKFSIQVLQ